MDENANTKFKVLMVGPDRSVKGGISSLVNMYYKLGIDEICDLKYISTMRDGSKTRKVITALLAYVNFFFSVRNYDIVHVHMSADTSYFRKKLIIKAAVRLTKKVVIHEHCGFFDEFFYKRCTGRQRERVRSIFSSVDKVIVLSDAWKKFYAENICSESMIAVANNNVICSDYVEKEYTDSNILFLGHITKDKGIIDLITAMAAIVKKIPDARLFIGGVGEIEQCRYLLKELDIEDSTEFLGWIGEEEKESYFNKCSIFALPSYYEGMPMSLLEAMAHGMVPVAANVGAIPEILESFDIKLMHSPGDTSELSEIVISLINDTPMKARIGKKSADIIRHHYSAENTLENLVSIYEKL